jgi:hypothetical protein
MTGKPKGHKHNKCFRTFSTETVDVATSLGAGGYVTKITLCPNASKADVQNALSSVDVIHLVGHGDANGAFECCNNELLGLNEIPSMPKTRFVYGSFCRSSVLGSGFTNKGPGAYVSWGFDVDDKMAENFAKEFYALALTKSHLSAGEAWLSVLNKNAGNPLAYHYEYDGPYNIQL